MFLISFLLFLSFFSYLCLNLQIYQLNGNTHESLRIMSTIHSVSNFGVSYLYLSNYISVWYFYILLNFISGGYFIFDILYLTIFKKKNLLYWQFFVHHTICLIAIINIKNYPLLIGQGFLAEITTPFMNISWWIHKNKKKKEYFYLYFTNALLMIFLYIKYRIFNFYQISYQSEFIIFRILISGILLLNLVWFIGICSIFIEDMKKYLIKN